MPDPQPVRPRRKDENAYYRALRRTFLEPLLSEVRAGVTEAASASMALDEIDNVRWDRGQQYGLVESEIAEQSAKLQGYHRDRLIQTFRTSLAVDIRGVLSEGEIDSLMSVWREENVRLVRTIPPRLHDGLLRRVSETFADAPFDRQALSRVLATEFQSSGWNLRRLTRDQVSKSIGQLTAARHRQMGISDFIWSDSNDERVRPVHVERGGNQYSWAAPPDGEIPGGPVLCRCVARPVIPRGFGRDVRFGSG